jgi:hypothetical protein
VKGSSVEAGGLPVLGSSPAGLTLRFVAGGRFGVGVVLRNRSSRAVTIVDARTVDPLDGLVHQTGTRLVPFDPPPCDGRHSCPAFGFLHSSYGPGRPSPLTIGPGKAAGVQLNYRLGTCDAVAFASAATARLLDVAYRYESGGLRREALPLGSARVRLRMPAPRDCRRGPSSRIDACAYA